MFSTTSFQHYSYVFRKRLQDVFKTSSKRIQDVLVKTNIFILLIHLQKTSSRRFQDVLPRRLQNALKTSCENVFQASAKHLPKTFQDVFRMSSRSLAKTSWRHLQDVFKTGRLAKMSSRPGLDYHLVNPQQTLKTSSRHVLKTFSKRLQRNNFLSSKTSSRRLANRSWRRLGKRKIVMLKTSWRHVLKTSWRYVLRTSWRTVFKTSWRRLGDKQMFTGNIFI